MAVNGRVLREAKAVTRREIIVKAVAGQLTWIQASQILGVTPRHMRRMREKYEQYGVDALVDGRGGRTRRRRVSVETIAEVCRLKRDVYPDFSMKHFHEKATEVHGLALSYTLMRNVLQDAGIVEKAPARGKYRRRRERRSMVGMMVHMDASTHPWIDGLPSWDLVVALDDADGRILYAQFFPEEGTHSTLACLNGVITKYGRFAELYTDRGSHYCRTEKAGNPPADEQNGQVTRACKELGIRQILALSPQARGRSERAFGTLQGRLPQELRLAGVVNYTDANRFLDKVFIKDFNKRFTVEPADPNSAFVRLAGIELQLVLSSQHDRVVASDNTVRFDNNMLQLPKGGPQRASYARCPVKVHEFLDDTLGVTHSGKLLARFSRGGLAMKRVIPKRVA